MDCDRVNAYLKVACAALEFEVGEVWCYRREEYAATGASTGSPSLLRFVQLYTSPEYEQRQTNLLRPKDVPDPNEVAEHRFSPMICDAVRSGNQMVWANTEEGTGLLGRSDLLLRTAVGVPVCCIGFDVCILVLFATKNTQAQSSVADVLMNLARAAGGRMMGALPASISSPITTCLEPSNGDVKDEGASEDASMADETLARATVRRLSDGPALALRSFQEALPHTSLRLIAITQPNAMYEIALDPVTPPSQPLSSFSSLSSFTSHGPINPRKRLISSDSMDGASDLASSSYCTSSTTSTTAIPRSTSDATMQDAAEDGTSMTTLTSAVTAPAMSSAMAQRGVQAQWQEQGQAPQGGDGMGVVDDFLLWNQNIEPIENFDDPLDWYASDTFDQLINPTDDPGDLDMTLHGGFSVGTTGTDLDATLHGGSRMGSGRVSGSDLDATLHGGSMRPGRFSEPDLDATLHAGSMGPRRFSATTPAPAYTLPVSDIASPNLKNAEDGSNPWFAPVDHQTTENVVLPVGASHLQHQATSVPSSQALAFDFASARNTIQLGRPHQPTPALPHAPFQQPHPHKPYSARGTSGPAQASSEHFEACLVRAEETRRRLHDVMEAFLEMSIFEVADCWVAHSIPAQDGRGPCNTAIRFQFSVLKTIQLKPFATFSSEITLGHNMGIPGKVIASNAPMWERAFHRKSATEFPRAQCANAYGISTAFGVPVADVGMGRAGAICFYSTAPLDHSPLVIEFIQKIVNIVSTGESPTVVVPPPLPLPPATHHLRPFSAAPSVKPDPDRTYSVDLNMGGPSPTSTLPLPSSTSSASSSSSLLSSSQVPMAHHDPVLTDDMGPSFLMSLAAGASEQEPLPMPMPARVSSGTTASTSSSTSTRSEGGGGRRGAGGRVSGGSAKPAKRMKVGHGRGAKLSTPAPAQAESNEASATTQKVCRMSDCNNPASKRSPYCTEHMGARQCQHDGCAKCAQGSTKFCIAHGGGRRCTHPGCTRGARDKFFCAAHGGGKRCSRPDCNKSAVGGSSLCTAHGGGRRCEHEGCNKSAQSSTRYCVRHGGGRKCATLGCEKVARGRTQHCAAHGGGIRCKHPGCNKAAVGRQQLCRVHSGTSVPKRRQPKVIPAEQQPTAATIMDSSQDLDDVAYTLPQAGLSSTP